MDAAAQAAAAAAEQVSSFDANDKYIGLGLAISSSFLIGTSFIITKKVCTVSSSLPSVAHDLATAGPDQRRRPARWLLQRLALVSQERAVVGRHADEYA